eukprot:539994_1
MFTYVNNSHIAIIGVYGVGKTSIINAHKAQYICSINDQIHEYGKSTQITFRNSQYDLHDIDNWELLTHAFITIVLVFSIDDRSTLYDLIPITKFIWNTLDTDARSTYILCGNKYDLEMKREVSYEEADEFVSKYSCHSYIETSAKSGYNKLASS